MIKNKREYLVYGHKCNDTGNYFYIGMAIYYYGPKSADRPYDISSKSLRWIEYMVERDFRYTIEIFEHSLNREEAQELESKLIIKYGRVHKNTGTLFNIQKGGFGGTLSYEEKRKKKLEKKKLQSRRIKSGLAKRKVRLEKEQLYNKEIQVFPLRRMKRIKK